MSLHQRGLTGAGGAHDGGELALLKVNGDVVEGVDGGFAHAVGLGQITCCYRRFVCGNC